MAATATPTGRHAYVAIFGSKVLRCALAWVSAYFAAKVQQDAYTEAVYFKEQEPPALTKMVFTFLMFQAVFGAIVIGLVAAALYVADPGAAKTTIMKMLIDLVLEVLMTTFVTTAVASTMQQKKYFNYRYEGPRAIRALRDLLWQLTIVVSVVPYALIKK